MFSSKQKKNTKGKMFLTFLYTFYFSILISLEINVFKGTHVIIIITC